MKLKDLQNIVVSKYQKADTSTEIHRHLNDGISLETIKRWCQMSSQTDSFQRRGMLVGPRIFGTIQNIRKVKKRLYRKQKVLARKLSTELGISLTRVRQILKIDLGLKS